MRATIVPPPAAPGVRGTSSRQLRHVSLQFVRVVLFRRLSSRATAVRCHVSPRGARMPE